jgi:hypothetical protein
MKVVFAYVGGFFLFLAVIAGLDYSSLIWESFIGPKRENVRRQVFEQTKSYNQGMQQDLIKFMHEYNVSKDPEEKKAISSTVRHMMSDYDESKLEPELRSFLTKCKYQ